MPLPYANYAHAIHTLLLLGVLLCLSIEVDARHGEVVGLELLELGDVRLQLIEDQGMRVSEQEWACLDVQCVSEDLTSAYTCEKYML